MKGDNATDRGKLYRGNVYQLGYELGVVRGMLDASAEGDASTRSAYDRAALAMVEAVSRSLLGIDAGEAWKRELYAEGVNDGRRAYTLGYARIEA